MSSWLAILLLCVPDACAVTVAPAAEPLSVPFGVFVREHKAVRDRWTQLARAKKYQGRSVAWCGYLADFQEEYEYYVVTDYHPDPAKHTARQVFDSELLFIYPEKFEILPRHAFVLIEGKLDLSTPHLRVNKAQITVLFE